MKVINIAIIEDHQIFIEALELLFRKEGEYAVTGTATSLREGCSLIRRLKADVLLLEIDLPDGDGFEIVHLLKEHSPKTRVVILTRSPDESALMRAVEAGVSGFLSKNCSLSEMMSTIHKAAQGEISMPTSLLVGLLKRISRQRSVIEKNAQLWERLTPRESEVLAFLARGKSGELIAEEMNIAPLTVRTHIRNIMSKLGVHSRLEAVSFALTNGIIDMPA